MGYAAAHTKIYCVHQRRASIVGVKTIKIAEWNSYKTNIECQ